MSARSCLSVGRTCIAHIIRVYVNKSCTNESTHHDTTYHETYSIINVAQSVLNVRPNNMPACWFMPIRVHAAVVADKTVSLKVTQLLY